MSEAAPILKRLRIEVMEPVELFSTGKNLAGNFSVMRSCSSNKNHDSYHMSVDQLGQCGPGELRSYTTKTERDRSVLNDPILRNFACGIDIKFPAAKLRAFSQALVDICEQERETCDLREIIYSVDGKTVLRWDKERLENPVAGEADNSHLWHTHASLYRDAVNKKRVLTLFIRAAHRSGMIDTEKKRQLIAIV